MNSNLLDLLIYIKILTTSNHVLTLAKSQNYKKVGAMWLIMPFFRRGVKSLLRSLHTFGFVLHFSVNVLHENECAEMRHAAVGSLCSQLVELV